MFSSARRRLGALPRTELVSADVVESTSVLRPEVSGGAGRVPNGTREQRQVVELKGAAELFFFQATNNKPSAKVEQAQ